MLNSNSKLDENLSSKSIDAFQKQSSNIVENTSLQNSRNSSRNASQTSLEPNQKSYIQKDAKRKDLAKKAYKFATSLTKADSSPYEKQVKHDLSQLISEGADPVEINTHIKSLQVKFSTSTQIHEFEHTPKGKLLNDEDILNSSDSASVNMFGEAGGFSYKSETILEILRELGANPDEKSAINAQYQAVKKQQKQRIDEYNLGKIEEAYYTGQKKKKEFSQLNSETAHVSTYANLSPRSRKEKQENDKRWAEYQKEKMYKMMSTLKKKTEISNIPRPAPVKSMKDMSPASRQAALERQKKIADYQSTKMEKIRDLGKMKTGLVKPMAKMVAVSSLSPKSKRRLFARRATIDQARKEAFDKIAERGKSKMLPPSAKGQVQSAAQKEMQDKLKAEQEEKSAALKKEVWLELWFAKSDFKDHLENDAEREQLSPEEFKEHAKYLHIEYLANKEHILGHFLTRLNEIQAKAKTSKSLISQDTARKISEYQNTKLQKAKEIGQLKREGKDLTSKLTKPKSFRELSPTTRNLRKQQMKRLFEKQLIEIQEAKKGKTPKSQLQIPTLINKSTISKKAVEERARKIKAYQTAKMHKTIELGKLKRRGESIIGLSKSVVIPKSVLISKEQQELNSKKIAEYLVVKLQKAKEIGQLRKAKLESKTDSKIPMTSLKDLSPKTRALRQQQMKILKERQMKVIEDLKNKDSKLKIPQKIPVLTKVNKEDLRKIQEYRDEKMKQTIEKGKLRKEGKVPQTEPKKKQIESPGTLALRKIQMQSLRKMQDQKIKEAAHKSKNKSAIPQTVSRPVSSKSLIIDEAQLQRIAEARAVKLEKAKEMGQLKKLGISLPKKIIKIPESKQAIESKQKLEKFKAKQEEIVKRLKAEVYTELYFAKADYEYHLLNDPERDELEPEDFKEHTHFLKLEYLIQKETIMGQYLARLNEIPTKETLLKQQKDKVVKENQEKFDQISKPKFIKNKVLSIAEKQKLGRTLDNEAKKKVIEAELRKIKLEEYKKATQKSHIATKVAKPRISMTTTKKVKLSPRKQLLMKALQATGLKNPLKLKETPSLRKPTLSVKKNLINLSIARLKTIKQKINVVNDDKSLKKSIVKPKGIKMKAAASKSKELYKAKPTRADEKIVSPIKDEKLTLDIEIPKHSTNFRDKFGITGDNRKQILLGLAKKWNAENKGETASKTIKPSNSEPRNFFQLRGNISELNPTFYTAFPGQGSEMKSFKSISDCLMTAWIKMKP